MNLGAPIEESAPPAGAFLRCVEMGSTTALRRALDASFFPYLAEQGFLVDARNQPSLKTCRRTADGAVQILGLQWDKYGRPRFAVHFGTCAAEGLQVGDDLFPAEDVLATWCPDRGTLRPRRGEWFRQDPTLLARLRGARSLREPTDIVDELVAHVHELDAYWRDGDVGPHLRLWGG